MIKGLGYQETNILNQWASLWLKEILTNNNLTLFTQEFSVYQAIYTYVEKVFTPKTCNFKIGFVDGTNIFFDSPFTTVVTMDMLGANSGFCTVIYERNIFKCTSKKGTRTLVRKLCEVVGYKCVYEEGNLYYRNFRHIPLVMPGEEKDKVIKDFFREVIDEENRLRTIIDEGELYYVKN